MAFGNENYDFMIPRNGSLFVELVDNMDQCKLCYSLVPTGLARPL